MRKKVVGTGKLRRLIYRIWRMHPDSKHPLIVAALIAITGTLAIPFTSRYAEVYGAPNNSDHVLRCKMTSERGAKNGQKTEAS